LCLYAQDLGFGLKREGDDDDINIVGRSSTWELFPGSGNRLLEEWKKEFLGLE